MTESAAPRDDFSHAFETAFARLQVLLEAACAGERDWPGGVAAAIRAGLEFAAADPAAAQTLTNEALAQGREGVARYERLLAYLGEGLLPGRAESADGERLPEVTERAMAGGILALIAERLDRGREHELSALAPEAIQFVLTPYLGAEAARRIGAEGEGCPR